MDLSLGTMGVDILDNAENEFKSVKALKNACLYATTVTEENGVDTTATHYL